MATAWGMEFARRGALTWPARVLVVDDHSFVRRSLRDILIRRGIAHVSEAANGRDAIAQLTAPGIAFDVIFCDLQTPDVDGIETLRAIAEIGINTAIVRMSGEKTEIIEAAETPARARGLQTLGHLTKPVAAKSVRLILSAEDRPAGREDRRTRGGGDYRCRAAPQYSVQIRRPNQAGSGCGGRLLRCGGQASDHRPARSSMKRSSRA